MHPGLALLGLIGGVVVGVGLHVSRRRERALLGRLAASGEALDAEVTAVTSTGYRNSSTRVRVRCADGCELDHVMTFMEAHANGLVVGARVTVRRFVDQPSDGRIALVEQPERPRHLPLLIGGFIAALGLVAALVV